MVWFFIVVLAILQGIGLMTILHFKKTLNSENEMKEEFTPAPSEPYERLGMTKEEYQKALSIVYGPQDDFSNFLNRPRVEFVEVEKEKEKQKSNIQATSKEESDQNVEVTDEELNSVFEGVSKEEIEALNNQNQEKRQLLPSVSEESNPIKEANNLLTNTSIPMNDLFEENATDWATFANDLDSINSEPPETSLQIPNQEEIKKEPDKQESNALKEESTNTSFQMGQGPSVSYENRKKSEVGESINLYKEVMASVYNESNDKDKNVETDIEIVFEEPIFQSDENIPLTDEDIPHFEILSDEEQEHFITALNILDREVSRLELETECNDKEQTKQQLTDRLTRLAELGEGKEHMKEIVYTLYQLYELEGRTEELEKLKEEYKSYFLEDEEDVELRIYEEDIIRVDKKKDLPPPFKIPEKYSWLASNKISEGKEGQQRWIGKVIGVNQNYIHFRDMSQRIWIFVGDLIGQIQIGDLLVINVHREGESVRAEEIYKLQEAAYEPEKIKEIAAV